MCIEFLGEDTVDVANHQPKLGVGKGKSDSYCHAGECINYAVPLSFLQYPGHKPALQHTHMYPCRVNGEQLRVNQL